MANKKNAAGSGTIRQKTVMRKGKEYTYWEGRVTTGYDPLSGKQIQRSFTGKTQREVQEKITAIQADVNNKDYLSPSKITLATWLEQWIEGKKDSVSLNTYKSYKERINNHIIPAFGKQIKLSDITKLHVQTFVDNLRKEKKLAPKTIRNCHGVLSKALEDAERLELIKRNPAAKCVLPQVKHKEVTPMTDKEVSDFLSIAATRKYGDVLTFILLTGLRESECLGLCWDVVDFNNNCITVKRQLQKHKDGYQLIGETKSKKSRTIVLPPSAMKILNNRKTRQTLDRFKAGGNWKGWANENEQKSYYVFTVDDGRFVTRDSLYMCLKRIAEKIGRPSLTVHDLRHAYATLCLQNGDDLKTVSDNLGHSTIAITADIYASVSQKMKTDSASRMEAYISNVS